MKRHPMNGPEPELEVIRARIRSFVRDSGFQYCLDEHPAENPAEAIFLKRPGDKKWTR
jgi:hypothetical protein